MIGEDFIFNNQMLSEYGMKMFDPEGDVSWVSREVDRADLTSIRPRPNHYGTHYSDTEKLDFLIIRDDEIYDRDNMELDGKEIDRLQTWLSSPKYPLGLEVVNNDERDVIYYGIFTDIQPFIVAKRCYGLYLTFTCDSPYGYSQKKTTSLVLANSISVYTQNIHVHSAELNEYLKPIIKVTAQTTFNGAHRIIIKNTTDGNKTMTLILPTYSSYAIIDCEKKLITDSSGNVVPLEDTMVVTQNTDEYSFLSVFNAPLYWLRLLPHDNSISVQAPYGGVYKVEFTTQEIVKAGGY